MKLAIVGSRTFNSILGMNDIIQDFLLPKHEITHIISGGAKGADSCGAAWAKENGIELVEFLPDWEQHGKSAGYIRNIDIVKNCDIVLAFWDGESKGTKHTIDLARKAKKLTFIVYF